MVIKTIKHPYGFITTIEELREEDEPMGKDTGLRINYDIFGKKG